MAHVPAEGQQVVRQFEFQTENSNESAVLPAEIKILPDVALRQVFPGMAVLHPLEPTVIVPPAAKADARPAALLKLPIEGHDLFPVRLPWQPKCQHDPAPFP